VTKSVDNAVNKMREKNKKIERFSEILDSLENTQDKKKLLWREVYENALTDRENAYILFSDLLIQAEGNSANHTMFGPIMSKYLERMSKSNDQILKLAELIAKAEEHEGQIDSDSIFDKIKDKE